MENPAPYIQLFIVVQCILFFAYLVTGQRLLFLPNKLLALLMAVLALHMGSNIVNQELQVQLVPSIGTSLGFCYGPILYLYTISLTQQNFRLNSRHLLHVLPALSAQLLVHGTSLPTLVFAIGIFASLISYTLLSWQHIKRYRYILSQTRSDYEQVALRWLSTLLVLQFVLLILNIGSVALHTNGYLVAGMVAEIILFFGLWLLVSFMVFQGMQQPSVFAGVSDEDQQVAESSNPEQGLPSEELQTIMASIDSHMVKSQAFLNSGLTVKSLGRQLSIIPKNISLAINGVAQKNFSEYVNSHRIAHACQLLGSEQGQQLSIMDVMYESGFVTKSNFNRAFKAETGCTPIEYKQKFITAN